METSLPKTGFSEKHSPCNTHVLGNQRSDFTHKTVGRRVFSSGLKPSPTAAAEGTLVPVLDTLAGASCVWHRPPAQRPGVPIPLAGPPWSLVSLMNQTGLQVCLDLSIRRQQQLIIPPAAGICVVFPCPHMWQSHLRNWGSVLGDITVLMPWGCRGNQGLNWVTCERNYFPVCRSYFYWLPWWLREERIFLQCRRPRFNPWVRKIPWRREQQPTPVFLPGESQRQRSLAGYSPWGRKSQTWLSN